MRPSQIGLDGEGLGDEVNGGIVFFHLKGDHTKQMQGDGLIGVVLQYLLIDTFRLGQATGGVVLDGKIYGLLDSWCLLLFRQISP